MPDHDSQQPRRRALRRLGRRVAELRTARGWNQKEFAQRIGRSINSLSRWENGTHQIGVLDALLVARELGTTLPELLGEPSATWASAGAEPVLLKRAQIDRLAEGIDLLQRSRRMLQKEGIDLLDEARRLLGELLP